MYLRNYAKVTYSHCLSKMAPETWKPTLFFMVIIGKIIAQRDIVLRLYILENNFVIRTWKLGVNS